MVSTIYLDTSALMKRYLTEAGSGPITTRSRLHLADPENFSSTSFREASGKTHGCGGFSGVSLLEKSVEGRENGIWEDSSW
jgi:hypothetical protein